MNGSVGAADWNIHGNTISVVACARGCRSESSAGFAIDVTAVGLKAAVKVILASQRSEAGVDLQSVASGSGSSLEMVEHAGGASADGVITDVWAGHIAGQNAYSVDSQITIPGLATHRGIGIRPAGWQIGDSVSLLSAQQIGNGSVHWAAAAALIAAEVFLAIVELIRVGVLVVRS